LTAASIARAATPISIAHARTWRSHECQTVD
jgi:hypothetical protein